MGTLGGITFTEYPGTNTLSYTPEGITGQRVFQVAWADRIDFAETLLGYVNAIGHVPIRWDADTFPDYDRLYCQDVQVEPVGEPSEVLSAGSYNLAKITATYRPWKRGTTNVEGDEEWDEDLEEAMATYTQGADFSAEFYSIPQSKFRYVDAPLTSVDMPVGHLVGSVDFTMTSDSEPEVRLTAIRNCIGKVNSTVWFGAAAGHTLFMGASVRRTLTSQGVGAWEISYRFKERTGGTWNSVYDGSAWRPIETDPGAQPQYASVNFAQLWGL